MNQTFLWAKVYGPATVMAAITLFGLLSALLGDGVWDTLSWGTLVIPLAVIVWKYKHPVAPRG